jgi:putative endonuclease
MIHPTPVTLNLFQGLASATLQSMTSPSKQPYVYILASKRNGTLYVGVTSDLSSRIHAHKTDAVPSFTQKYGIHTLVYAESFETMDEAILREKQLKAGSRSKKIALIEKSNPQWLDLEINI